MDSDDSDSVSESEEIRRSERNKRKPETPIESKTPKEAKFIRVGSQFQALIPSIPPSEEERHHYQHRTYFHAKSTKTLWDPSQVENNELHLYFEALEKKVGGKQYLVSEEEALRVLRLCQYNQRKALRIFGVTEKVSHEGETDDDESGEEIDSDPETDEAETLAEDHCFVCKEEGTLLLCDFKDCFKGYHCACLNMSEDTLPDGDWVCPLHSCKVCQKLPDPDTSCKMCPTAYCAYCNVNFPVGPAIESHLCGPCTKFVRETILPHGEGYLKVQFLQSKSLFVNLLQSFHERFGRPLTSFEPTNSTDLDRFDVYQLYSIVCSYGGFDVVERFGIWELISCNMGMSPDRRTACSLKEYYKDAILMFEEEYFVTEELGIQERLSKFLKREQMDMDILAPVANE